MHLCVFDVRMTIYTYNVSKMFRNFQESVSSHQYKDSSPYQYMSADIFRNRAQNKSI